MSKSDEPTDRGSSKIGYRNPPKSHQFRKGRSGNPRGRKPGGENMIVMFKRLAARRIKVNDNGRTRLISWAEAIILQNYKAALQKKPDAMANMFRLAEEADEFMDWTDPNVAGKPIFMPAKMSEEEFSAQYDSDIVRIPSRTSGQQAD